MNPSNPLHILIADPHPIIREGLNALLSCQDDMHVAGQAAYSQEALDLFRVLRPHVLIMEVDQPDKMGIEVIRTLTKRFPCSHILILSYHEEEEIIFQALQAGAKGYYSKDTEPEILVNAVRRVYAGETALAASAEEKLASRLQKQTLSRRELEVLPLLMTGLSNQEIAAKLFIAIGTVKIHICSILRKLEAHDRTQAAINAVRRGIVVLP